MLGGFRDTKEIKLIDYIKLLIDRIDRHGSEVARAQFIRNLIRSEALANLDVLRILQLKNVRKHPEEMRRAITCFNANASDLMVSLGISPESVLEGDRSAIEQGLVDSPNVGGKRLDSKQDFERQSDLWLFTFADRKIRLLLALAQSGFDVHGLLRLNKRLTNVGYALRILYRRLNVEPAN